MAFLQSERAILHEYARYHGLCRPDNSSYNDITLDIPDAFDLESRPTDSAQAAMLSTASNYLAEKLSVDRETGRYLASVLKWTDKISALKHPIEDSNRSSKSLKLDTPVLQTDPELDLCQFVHRTKELELFSVDELKLQRLCEDVRDDDNSLEWPPWCLMPTQKFDSASNTEKLQVDRNVISWLQLSLKDPGSFSPCAKASLPDLLPQKSSRARFITPPLSPAASNCKEAQLKLSSPPPASLLISEHTSPTVHISKKLDDAIFSQDALLPETGLSTINEAGIHDSFQELKQIFPSIEPENKDELEFPHQPLTSTRFQVDETLMPAEKPQRFGSMSSEDLSIYFQDLPPLGNFEHNHSSDNEFGLGLPKFMDQEARKAKFEMENEKLLEADTVMRLKVPDLDFSAPVAPWKRKDSSKELADDLRLMISAITEMKLSQSNLHRLEKDLCWVPFPMDSLNVAVQEQLVDEEAIQTYVSLNRLPSASITFDNLVWKLPGMRVLEEDSDEEELEQGQLDKNLPLASLLKKRKAELEYGTDERTSLNSTCNTFTRQSTYEEQLIRTKKSLSGECQPADIGDSLSKLVPPSLFPSNFSATDQLTSFMWVKTGEVKRQKVDASKSQRNLVVQSLSSPCKSENIHFSKLDCSSDVARLLEQDRSASLDAHTISNPLSSSSLITQCNNHDQPKVIIVPSTQISQHRGLFKRLLEQLPNLDLISKDYQSESVPTDNDDNEQADITIPPSTGVLLTTLQKVKQRPLPGQSQKDLPAVRAQITRLSSCYKELHIFVSRGMALQERILGMPLLDKEVQNTLKSDVALPDLHEVTNEDIDAVLSLKKFAGTLKQQCVVNVEFVNGSTDAIVQRIMKLVVATR